MICPRCRNEANMCYHHSERLLNPATAGTMLTAPLGKVFPEGHFKEGSVLTAAYRNKVGKRGCEVSHRVSLQL